MHERCGPSHSRDSKMTEVLKAVCEKLHFWKSPPRNTKSLREVEKVGGGKAYKTDSKEDGKMSQRWRGEHDRIR